MRRREAAELGLDHGFPSPGRDELHLLDAEELVVHFQDHALPDIRCVDHECFSDCRRRSALGAVL
jgi:hypothetical protein